MKYVSFSYSESLLTIYLKNKLDTVNSDEAEQQILSNCIEHSPNQVVINASELRYISSAGLRLIHRLLKKYHSLRIIECSSEVYDIFEMTGFTELLPIEKSLRTISVKRQDLIGKGASGEVYRTAPDTAVKVFRDSYSLSDVERERTFARKAFVLGLPTALSYDTVRVSGSSFEGIRFGSVIELLNASSFSSMISKAPDTIGYYANEFAKLLKTIHSTNVNDPEIPSGKETVLKWSTVCTQHLSSEDNSLLTNLISTLPETHTLLHGDYHTNNLLRQGDETLLIDMNTLCIGHPVIDLANIYLTYVGFQTYSKRMVEEFLSITSRDASAFWQLFLISYFGTHDSTFLLDVQNKAELLSLMRLIYHFIRRNDTSPNGIRTVEYAENRLHSLLHTIDSLVF